ncbi:MAG: dihydropteroate synthase [Rhodoferax sp.]
MAGPFEAPRCFGLFNVTDPVQTTWHTARHTIDLRTPRVMGIVNLTPDSFSDGGAWADPTAALRHCERLLREGVDILDLGAESSRPGAQPVPAEQELQRLLPVLREAVRMGVPVSVDTYKPAVMRAALDAGADIVNDIWALRWRDPACPGLGAAEVLTAHPKAGVCLMHMHRDPQTMQVAPMQGDVVPQVLSFLELVSQSALALGLEKSQILLDPGIGFGKTVAQNFALLSRQRELLVAGHGLLVGWSRKSSLAGMGVGETLAPQERLAPSLAALVLALERGASVVRVHDVAASVQARNLWLAAR